MQGPRVALGCANAASWRRASPEQRAEAAAGAQRRCNVVFWLWLVIVVLIFIIVILIAREL